MQPMRHNLAQAQDLRKQRINDPIMLIISNQIVRTQEMWCRCLCRRNCVAPGSELFCLKLIFFNNN